MQVDVLNMSARELLFAASKLGAEVFFGLPDPFFGLDETDITQELIDLQLSLERKGYASMGFDDAFKLSPKAEKLVSTCVYCERYIVADFIPPGGEHKNLVFYFREEKAVAVSHEKDGLVLRTIEPSDTAGQLWQEMSWPKDIENAANSPAYRISYEGIARAQSIAGSDSAGAAKLLLEEGCPELLAKVLVDGFRRDAHFYSISVSDLKMKKFEYIACVCTKSEGVVLASLNDGDDDSWGVRITSDSQLKTLLEQLCEGTFLEGGSLL
jgi:hypothetical protein